jgi:hypothetical protein
MIWHERLSGKILLRLGGLGLLGLAWAVAHILRQRAMAGPLTGQPIAYLLAMLMFVFASAGAALAFVGSHLFDKIDVAARWSRLDVSPVELPPDFGRRSTQASWPSPPAPPPAPLQSRAAPPAPDAATGPAAASPDGLT